MPYSCGYSDRINHALAFAAKHNDQQVRRGTRSPYLTQPANVAVILTRYGCDEDTVVAGVLRDVVEDLVRGGFGDDLLKERIGDKFGDQVMQLLLAVTPRRVDDAGIELSAEERRDDLLRRLTAAPKESQWIFCATSLHAIGSLLADLQRTVDVQSVWSRTTLGRDGTLSWYRRVQSRLDHAGFGTPIADELRGTLEALENY